MAYAVLMTLPLLAVFLAFQRHFVQGVASSGIKG
jgi:multiple sugar transport system permease protein